jgi:ankyrin repeat protein
MSMCAAKMAAPHCTMRQKTETQVAKLLLEHGADVNARNKLGYTPFELGSRMGHYEIVELLSAYSPIAKSVNQ